MEVIMDCVDIINLILSVATLLATIFISFLIYFLERKSRKRKENKEIEETARKFIIENSAERDYLPWCTIASACFPQNKHCRKIYNNFVSLPKAVQKEVLHQVDYKIDLIEDNKWIESKVALVKEAIIELDLGADFLYGNAKYFHRAYAYKQYDYNKYSPALFKKNYENIFKLKRMSQPIDQNLYFSQYLEDYLFCKYKELNKMPKNVKKPIDYLLYVEKLRSTADEAYVCFWMMVVIEETIGLSVRYLDYKEDWFCTDAVVETFEDKYFSVLFNLYYYEKTKKSNNKRS